MESLSTQRVVFGAGPTLSTVFPRLVQVEACGRVSFLLPSKQCRAAWTSRMPPSLHRLMDLSLPGAAGIWLLLRLYQPPGPSWKGLLNHPSSLSSKHISQLCSSPRQVWNSPKFPGHPPLPRARCSALPSSSVEPTSALLGV